MARPSSVAPVPGTKPCSNKACPVPLAEQRFYVELRIRCGHHSECVKCCAARSAKRWMNCTPERSEILRERKRRWYHANKHRPDIQEKVRLQRAKTKKRAAERRPPKVVPSAEERAAKKRAEYG